MRNIQQIRCVLLAFFLLLGALAPAVAQSVNAKNLIKLARSAADQNDWEKAKDYAEKAIKEEPAYLDAYYMRAFAYRELGEKAKAEKDFREIIRLEPQFLGTYGALAEIYLDDKEYEKAEKVFTQLGQQIDGAKWASYYRGVMEYQRGDLKLAEGHWKDVIAKEQNFAMAQHSLGAIYLAQKNYPKALSFLREGLNLKPENAMYRFHVAYALEKLQRVSEAQDLLKQIMNENSDDQRFWLLARAYDQMLRGKPEGSTKVLETLTKDYSKTFEVWLIQGRVALALGQEDAARRALSKASDLDPKFQEVDDLLAKLPAPSTEPPSPSPEPVDSAPVPDGQAPQPNE